MAEKTLSEATLGGGCFWCTEAVFQRVRGVEKVISGYSGGTVPGKPTYREICSGRTGHAEVVRILFDPALITYRDLLLIFMGTHDPTTLNRQGADVGTQYRSIVLYHNDEQQKLARETIQQLDSEKIWRDPIVTQVEAFDSFYSAEAYHQEYYENNPNMGYCRMVITPKVEKFEKVFRDKLK